MSEQKDEVLVLSRILDKSNNNQLVGFVMLDLSNGMIYRLKTDKVQAVLQSNYCSNAKWDESYKTLVGTANSLTEYPSIGTDGSAIDKKGMTASHRILDEQTGEEIGAVVFDAFGKQFNLASEKLVKLNKEKGVKGTNFILTSEGTIISKVKGYEFRTITMKSVGNRKSYRSSKGEKTPIVDTDDCLIPTINVSGFDNIKDNSFASSAQDNMLLALSNLRKVSPYYHTVLSSIKKTPVQGLGTLCVDEKDLYYDVEFVSKLTVEELTFILIHELMHILMRHSLRGRKKNHDLWNLATDLYINEMICSEVGIDSLDKIVEVDGGLQQRGKIKAQKDGIYAFKYGISLDLSKDTPETIYTQMCKENENLPSSYKNSNTSNQESNSNGMGMNVREAVKEAIRTCNSIRDISKRANEEARKSSDNQSMKDALDSNNEAKQLAQKCRTENDCAVLGQDMVKAGSTIEQLGKQMEQNGNSRGEKIASLGEKLRKLGNSIKNSSSKCGSGSDDSNSSGQSSSGQNSGGQNSNGQSSNGQSSNGQSSGGDGDFEDLNGSKPEQGDEDSNESDGGNNTDQTGVPKGHKRIKAKFKGQEIDAVISKDVVSSVKGDSEDATKQAVDATKNALQRAKTKLKMEEEKTGSKFSSKLGSGEMDRQIDYGLSADISWQSLLRNITPRKNKKQFTMASPSRAYMNRGITMATRQNIGRPNVYTGIKFAIDVSGSVGTQELNEYLADVSAIFDKYEVDGELIYWSTMVGDAGRFTDKKDALKVRPITSGGTDVRCVFDYLIGKTKVNEKFEDTKPRDIEAVFILTDGYFSDNYSDYKTAFGNKVVWIIDGDPSRFRPPFGRVVGLHKETN